MKLDDITAWLDRELDSASFDDVSNNGLQIARRGACITRAAVAVDASVRAIRRAAACGAELLVVHHGLSWGGGIRRLTGGVYAAVQAAMEANLALYASHLPLDASEKYGNNFELARHLGLTELTRAFDYHGNTIGVIGRASAAREVRIGRATYAIPAGTIGVCSGGAGAFAEEAKARGCALLLTGEADWGEVIAAENAGATLVCAGHYETETFGVRAIGRALAQATGIEVTDLTEELHP